MASSTGTKSTARASETSRRTRSSTSSLRKPSPAPRQQRNRRVYHKSSPRHRRSPTLELSEDDQPAQSSEMKELTITSTKPVKQKREPTLAILRHISSLQKTTVDNGHQQETFEVGD